MNIKPQTSHYSFDQPINIIGHWQNRHNILYKVCSENLSWFHHNVKPLAFQQPKQPELIMNRIYWELHRHEKNNFFSSFTIKKIQQKMFNFNSFQIHVRIQTSSWSFQHLLHSFCAQSVSFSYRFSKVDFITFGCSSINLWLHFSILS